MAVFWLKFAEPNDILHNTQLRITLNIRAALQNFFTFLILTLQTLFKSLLGAKMGKKGVKETINQTKQYKNAE